MRVVAVPRWRPRRLATRRPPPVTTLIRKGPRSWRNNATTTLGCVTDYRIVKESGRPAAPPRPGRSGPPASAPRSPRAGLWPGGGAGVLRADGHAPRPEASGLFPTPHPPDRFNDRLDFSSEAAATGPCDPDPTPRATGRFEERSDFHRGGRERVDRSRRRHVRRRPRPRGSAGASSGDRESLSPRGEPAWGRWDGADDGHRPGGRGLTTSLPRP